MNEYNALGLWARPLQSKRTKAEDLAQNVARETSCLAYVRPGFSHKQKKKNKIKDKKFKNSLVTYIAKWMDPKYIMLSEKEAKHKRL